MTTGERIKARRKQIGMNAETLASKVGLSATTIYRYESGGIDKVSGEVLVLIASALQTTPAYLMGWEETPLPANAIPVPEMRRIPILGSIRAGVPIFAEENIEGYGFADVPEDDKYYYLRVKGDSMVNARIYDGDLVLIRQQPCADEGQIVACLVNGDEATLKRFYRQKNMVILKPENPSYSPLIVPCKDFESGEACILGVVVKVEFKP